MSQYFRCADGACPNQNWIEKPLRSTESNCSPTSGSEPSSDCFGTLSFFCGCERHHPLFVNAVRCCLSSSSGVFELNMSRGHCRSTRSHCLTGQYATMWEERELAGVSPGWGRKLYGSGLFPASSCMVQWRVSGAVLQSARINLDSSTNSTRVDNFQTGANHPSGLQRAEERNQVNKPLESDIL